MKPFTLGILATVLTSAAFADTDISGKWSGSAGVPLYVTFKQEGATVSGTAGQTENDRSLAFTDARLEGDRLTIRAGQFTFDLRVKGDEITGELDAGGERHPVVLRRAAAGAAGPRAFEVAAIKHVEAPPGGYSSSMKLDPGRLTCTFVSLRKLIVNGYGIKDYQFVGPDWMSSELYDIVATMPAGSTGVEVMPMIQTLLAERFRVAIHRETREMPVYALVVGRNGTPLKPVEFGRSSTSYSPGQFVAVKTAMDKFAEFLARQVDRPVLNMTELKGLYDFKLEFSTDEAHPESGTPLIAAMQQQIGLKLEARKAPVEMLVVDHAEKIPTAN
jgi:uncharacterized protein (TIGR03435 family)